MHNPKDSRKAQELSMQEAFLAGKTEAGHAAALKRGTQALDGKLESVYTAQAASKQSNKTPTPRMKK